MQIKTHFQNLELTQDQDLALEKIDSFLNSNEKIFLLKGYAGTGKTTLLKGICKYLNQDRRQEVKLLAPTGRAAMILQKKTGLSASTIHRGIYNFDDLQERKEGDSFKFFFGLNENSASVDAVYLIDEASMISDKYTEDEFFMFGSGLLLKDLFKYVYGRELNRKIIFIGDNAQLPPVNMDFSPALNSEYILENYETQTSEIELKNVVRQDGGSGILNSATLLRNAIEKNTYNEFIIDRPKSDIIDVLPENVLDHYKEVAKNGGIENAIIITHSNKQALEYNKIIREKRYGNGEIEIQQKDILLITKNNYNGEVEIFNGMFVKVIEAGGISRRQQVYFKTKEKTENRELIFRDVLVEVEDISGRKRNIRTTLLDDFLLAKEGKLDPLFQQALYVDFKNRMAERGIRPRTKDFKDAIKEDLYFNALQAKYGYAITCHKSQGGEWDNVFVDFKVYMGILSKGFFRWAYTAITRSAKKLLVIDAPNYNALSKYVVKDIGRLSGRIKGAIHTPIRESDPLYFVEYKQNGILNLCKAFGITVHFDTSKSYQLITTFSKSNNSNSVVLWYKKNGFSKTTWLSESDDEFQKITEEILEESLIPESIPFEPRFPFQKDLNEYIKEILEEENIAITNIIQKEWSDQYFIKTNAECALLEFNFNKKHIYTFAQPKSTLGNEDELLNNIIERLRGNR